jgi:hypothetical protein
VNQAKPVGAQQHAACGNLTLDSATFFHFICRLGNAADSHGDSMAVSIRKALAAFGAQSKEWKRGIPARLNSLDFRNVSNAR